jgi:quercetin dioxygenase-like cupin family protein
MVLLLKAGRLRRILGVSALDSKSGQRDVPFGRTIGQEARTSGKIRSLASKKRTLEQVRATPRQDDARDCGFQCSGETPYIRGVHAVHREVKMKLASSAIVRLLILTAAMGPSALWAAEAAGPLQPEEIQWGAAPPVLPAGALMAVLAGDPAGTGLITIRLKMPAGYRIPPHWHPTDEHVTVISGLFAIGMGDKVDMAKSKTLKAGGYAVAAANMHHFAWTKTGAVVQVNMLGPFQITYINPADDPSRKK